MGKWKQVKARTEHSCEACSGEVIKPKEQCWTETGYGGAYPDVKYYCLECGPIIKGGGSFNDARKHKEETGGYRCHECRKKYKDLTEYRENHEDKLLCTECLSKKPH